MLLNLSAFSQETAAHKFAQLGEELPTPNVYRNGAGAPGHEYWQQRADYKIDVSLIDSTQQIFGEETVTYYNNSPDNLDYLWLQLDQNMRSKESNSYKIRSGGIGDKMTYDDLMTFDPWFDGGFKLEYVQDNKGNDLSYVVNQTMMRIDLESPLVPGAAFTFKVKWHYNINDRMKIGGRSGYEYFEEDDNYLYTIAQFFPRMAVYDDVNGWQNKQFLGRGEFALTFGNYEVNITVPADHVVASTGECQNLSEMIGQEKINLFNKAKNSDKPVVIISQAEAEEREKTKASGTKTWRFKADNVRDFAFASSRKFIWDAQGVKFGDRTVMAMSYYPKEGNPLWERYSTASVVQTLHTYSKHTFDYPYPVAISVNAARIGMEYPMICFNFGRTEKDGTYSERTRNGMIGVIIHEVGHNYFPMIVNSDERQWTWMDEGLNSFLQFLTEQEFERDFPSRRGEPRNIVDYMKGDKSNMVPIMTNSESILQFGNNAYGKPATALNILRETVMGRELFDHAFRTYAQRWMFKHPSPADFFRSMEDASAIDLDWFWRGWFYTTDHVDISLDNVQWKQVEALDPEVRMQEKRSADELLSPSVTQLRNREYTTTSEKDSSLIDFYSHYDEYAVDAIDRQSHEKILNSLSEEERALYALERNIYELTFSNKGGLVMPLVLMFKYEDGTEELINIPAEIWKMNAETITKSFMREKQIESIILDPYLETADTDVSNNTWPPQFTPSRFQLYKQREQSEQENKMQRNRRSEELDE